MMKTKRHTSSGGVVFRFSDSILEVALIAHHNLKGRQVWSLPKGTVEKGESLEETARREVREETGLVGRLVDKVGLIRYWFFSKEGARIRKTVHFFLFEYESGHEAEHDREVEEARWVPFNEAVEMLTHASEKEIVAKAGRYLLEKKEVLS